MTPPVSHATGDSPGSHGKRVPNPPATPPDDEMLRELNVRFERATPATILGWAWEHFQPAIIASSSFQTQSLLLLDMIARLAPQMPVVFVDTGFHFSETLEFRDAIQRELGLNVRTISAKSASDETPKLYQHDPDACCRRNKVDPLKAALVGMRAWISGIRRDQSAVRRQTDIVTRLPTGLVKVCPFANMPQPQVDRFIQSWRLSVHPLTARGYASIGCGPCTQPCEDSSRNGRWSNSNKSECGLHEPGAFS